MNWTRAHDAWIAEHCEGLEVHENINEIDWVCAPRNEWFKWRRVREYNTDPAACIRAAEAWAAKDSEYRSWTLARAGTLLGQCMDEGHHYIHEGEDGLAWALYEATGGPA